MLKCACVRKVDNNNIGDEGGKMIGVALKENHTLTTLYLGNLKFHHHIP